MEMHSGMRMNLNNPMAEFPFNSWIISFQICDKKLVLISTEYRGGDCCRLARLCHALGTSC